MEVKLAYFIPCFIAPFSTSSFVFTVVFLFCKHPDVIQKLFQNARCYMITSSFQMSNKFRNLGSWLNIYVLPLLWCSYQIIAMFFWFEAALFMCSKNVWNYPRQIFFFKKIKHFAVNKRFISSFLLLVLIVLLVIVPGLVIVRHCSCLAFKTKPMQVDESSYTGRNSYCPHKIVMSV